LRESSPASGGKWRASFQSGPASKLLDQRRGDLALSTRQQAFHLVDLLPRTEQRAILSRVDHERDRDRAHARAAPIHDSIVRPRKTPW